MRLHELKSQMQSNYIGKTKTQKKIVSQQLVDLIHQQGGRFLKQDDSGNWFEVTNTAAREKAAQALRENFSPEDRRMKRLRYLRKQELMRQQQQQRGVQAHPV